MKQTHVVERITAQANLLYFQEHLARYQFSSSYVRPGIVLDIAGGSGYGSALLAQNPKVSVVSVDVDLQSLQTARRDYIDQRIAFLAADGCRLPFPERSFSTIVSLETVEHIKDDVGYLRELGRVLRPDGICVLSTPNRAYSESIRRSNPFHVREYSESELTDLLRAQFSEVEVFYQGFANTYHASVKNYAQDIQQKKRELNSFPRLLIDKIYRPIKTILPSNLTNFFIRRLLRLSFPQPMANDIVITRNRPPETSVFVAVCANARTA